MTWGWTLVGHGACALLALGAVGLLHGLGGVASVRADVAAHVDRLDADLGFLRRALPARSFVAAQIGAACACGAVAAGSGSLAALALGIACLAVPQAWIRHERARRVGQIESQLDGWLTTLSNALKANPSLGEAVASTVALVPAPISEELDLVVKEHRLGAPLDRALAAMSSRCGSRVLRGAVVTLRVARRTGGDLSRTLEGSAASLRELARVEGVVRSKTAEGRAQSLLIGILPAPMFLLLEQLQPGFLAPLFASLRGHLVLAAAGALWAVALAWSRRIVAVDV